MTEDMHNDMNELNEPKPGDTEPLDERELLISRVLDDEASDEEFDRVRELAAIDSSIWRDLGEAQRLHDGLCGFVEDAGVLADRVELDTATAPQHRLGMIGRAVLGRGGGWLAAAVVLAVWSVTAGFDGSMPVSDSMPAGIGPTLSRPATADEALQQYLDVGREQGKVIGELPGGKVLERRPLADGSGYEVLYVRPILERAIVTDVYRMAQDEVGNASPVPVEPTGAVGAQ